MAALHHRFRGHDFRGAAMVAALCAAAACESPSATFDGTALGYGFQRSQVAGDGFDHVIYRKPGPPGALHIYLASDGMPWLRGRLPADDPTSRTPVILDLMAEDPAESVLLGRPCYHGLQAETGCGPEMWTERRYSAEVVTSLAAAAGELSDGRRPLVLIGHSGGGVLALLLAAHLRQVLAVVTIAAPVDHAAWTSHHRYLPLEGSLNPVGEGPLPERIRQLHFVGARDRVVPSDLLSRSLAQIAAPPPFIVAGLGHEDGWPSVWPAILDCLAGPPASEAVAQAERDDMLLTPGMAKVADVGSREGGSLIECHRE